MPDPEESSQASDKAEDRLSEEGGEKGDDTGRKEGEKGGFLTTDGSIVTLKVDQCSRCEHLEDREVEQAFR